MTVSEIARMRGLDIRTEDLIRQLSELGEDYVRQTIMKAPPDFDEARYVADNPDVGRALAEGRLKGAFDHFAKHGRFQGRERPVTRANESAAR